MMQEDDKWIKAIKDTLSDYSEPLPEKGWDRLSLDLNRAKSPKKISKWVFVSLAAAAAILIALWLIPTNSQDSPLLPKDIIAEIVTDTSKAFVEDARQASSNTIADGASSSSSKTTFAMVGVNSEANNQSMTEAKGENNNLYNTNNKDITKEESRSDVKAVGKVVSGSNNKSVAENTSVSDINANPEKSSVSDNNANPERSSVSDNNANLEKSVVSYNNAEATQQKVDSTTSFKVTNTEQKKVAREISIDEYVAQAIGDEDDNYRKNDNGSRLWSLNAGISGQSNNMFSSFLGSDIIAEHDILSDFPSSDPIPLEKITIADAKTPSSSINLENHSYSSLNCNYKHYQPISVGLSVNKFISDRVSIGSGVTYTMLYSDVLSSLDIVMFRQKIHTIGIPLNIYWDFYREGNLSAYLSAGGMVEKCIIAKIGSDYTNIKPLSWSISANIGGQTMIFNNTALYIETGLLYHFPTDWPLSTIHTTNRYSLKIQAGFRFYL